MKQEEKDIFLRCVKMRGVAGWSVEVTAAQIWGFIQSPFLNKIAIAEGIELFERGVVEQRIFRQFDAVRKREIERRRKNIEKKNANCLVSELSKLKDAPQDMFE